MKDGGNSLKFLSQTGGIDVPCPCVWVAFVTVFTGIIWWRGYFACFLALALRKHLLPFPVS